MILIVCCPICDIIIFPAWAKKLEQKFKYLKNEKVFKMKKKHYSSPLKNFH